MADITKCFHGCKDQNTCWRWKAQPNLLRQSYSDFKPDSRGVCGHYWPLTAGEAVADILGNLTAIPKTIPIKG